MENLSKADLKLKFILADLAIHSLDSRPVDPEILGRLHLLFDIIESSKKGGGNEIASAIQEAFRLIELEFNPPKITRIEME